MTTCPQCASDLPAHDGVTTRGQPKPDDVALCAYCGQIGIFTEDGDLRLPTREELDAILDHPGLMATYAALMKAATIPEAVALARQVHARLS
jgi:hypothetical protein